MIEALLQAERLLVHGQVDQAEQIYAGAAAQDPNNAIAVVGLARVALERGDERLAYERSREALAIDPQNAAAQRLAARLAEVFAARAHQPAPALPTDQPPEAPRPSEQAVFNRNPSMSDHTAAEERRQPELPHASPPEARGRPEEPPQEPPNLDRRSGLWRRILGE
ncbi:MAG TPA: tetratricopeptide repeat protein [Candidatus Limnocylindrales bacterium]|nr:tetratricopeptide repeat protein [Candidatus Limnocylindrales bacterium]